MSLIVEDKRVVSMHYKLSDDDGKVMDSSEGKDPLTYIHGTNNIILGLEKELVGKAVGDKVNAKVVPAEGYGDVNPELIQTVKKEIFKGVESVEVGMEFESEGPNQSVQKIVIKKVEGDDVTIDGNHPLAGVNLNFDVEIVEVREATQQELDHGHVHAGGHDH